MTRPDRAPLSLTIGAATTPLGDLLLVADIDGKLRAAEFSDREARLHLLLDRRLGKGGYRLAAGAVPPGVATALDAYFAGDVASIDRIEVAMAGTAFQERVWRGLRAIRPGTTRSYRALAGELGLPRSARAVGHANGANPFEIVVPCHRLVATSGALTGYAGGLDRKRWLLDHEARHAPH